MFMFFFIMLFIVPIIVIFKQFNKSSRSEMLILSIIYMIQTMLLITHLDMKNSSEWVEFTDGFQYFKFNFRFLNPILHIREKIADHGPEIPSRMYSLFLEDRSAAV